MFAKLRTARYLKTTATGEAAVVEFAGKVQRIARIHQEGLNAIASRCSMRCVRCSDLVPLADRL